MRFQAACWLLVLLLCGAASLCARTIVVDPSGAGDATEIQAAIDAATSGDVVLVKPGDYVIAEPITFRGKGITVRSEAGPDATTIRMAGQPADPRRASVVIFESGEPETAVLEGFTLTGGKGTAIPYFSNGAGGGVLCINGSSPTLLQCVVTRNSAEVSGGGLFCGEGASAKLVDCTLSKNSAGYAGGIACHGELSLTRCNLTRNHGAHGSGAMNASGDGTVTLSHCTISGNTSTRRGVLAFGDNVFVVLRNCTVSGNAAVRGAVIRFEEYTTGTLVNTIVWGNVGPALVTDTTSAIEVSYSLIEAEDVWPGVGNINLDPLFCGWPVGELTVANLEQLDKTFEGFRFTLSSGSPCLGSGENGEDMGSQPEGCESPGPASARIQLAAGTYDISKGLPALKMKLAGSGEKATVLKGTVTNLRSGSVLSGLTVDAEGRDYGIEITGGAAPEIVRCTITGARTGVRCTNSSVTLTDSTISECRFGGLLISDSTATLIGCTLIENGSCAGSFINSSVTLRGCEVSGNREASEGTLSCGGGSLTIVDSTISRNAALDGGALACRGGASVTLQGCTLSANSARRRAGGILCTTGAVLSATECTIRGNSASEGGGILCLADSSVTLTDCSILSNEAQRGGGILCEESASASLVRCRVSGNSATVGGGLNCRDSAAISLVDCEIAGNEATSGGGIATSKRSTIGGTGCAISWNVAKSGGGVLCESDSSLTLFGSTLSGNAALHASALQCKEGSTVALRNCTLTANVAVARSTIQSLSPEFLRLTNCIVWGNFGEPVIDAEPERTEVRYSCIQGAEPWPGEGNISEDPLFCGWAAGELRVTDQQELEAALGMFRLTLSADSPCLGSGENGADMGSEPRGCDEPSPVEHLTVRLAPGTYRVSGAAPAHGVSLLGAGRNETLIAGTLFAPRSDTVVSDLTVTGGSRGGIVVLGGEKPSILRSRIRRNLGDGVTCVGSSPMLSGCEIAENYGSGISCNQASPSLTNCAIWGNYGELGSGVFCYENSSPVLFNCTVSGNGSRLIGGGVTCFGGSSPTIVNSIVWGNFPESACGEISHSITDTDPLFVSPGVFDFTRYATEEIAGRVLELPAFAVEPPDFRLRPESPAIDSGTCEGAPPVDIAGTPRPHGAGCDIGAYEFAGGAPEASFRRGDADADGLLNVSDAVRILRFLFEGQAAPLCEKSADVDDSGRIDVSDPIVLLRFLFLGGRSPAPPFPECGRDPTPEDGLTCLEFPPCSEGR